ncbi:unnamed protein product [Clonostachys chloroleuca]|uniref:Uncharacterized protein n=1 Tax=Clonostachys chloroleuca TaxID=1926264 RepID=A0AA35VUV7_9HYPO|nr:unnamed protein product [Clonostachys chloroleuca]
MRELAIESIKALDFDEAIRLIKEVVCDGFETKRRNFDYFETFSQLILCYFFQGEWRLTEPLVNLLSQSNGKMPDPSHELVICNFFHALSLCYLAEYSFKRALEYCKKAVCGKRRLYKAGQADRRDYEETLGLYATIYEVSGDCLREQRSSGADCWQISHTNTQRKWLFFFQGHEKLLSSIICSVDIQTLTEALLTSTAELAATPTDATHGGVPAKISDGKILRMKLTRYEMLERDTAKEAVVDTLRSPHEAYDELSPLGMTTTHPQSPKEKSPIRRAQQLKASSHLESVSTSHHELGDTSLHAELGDTSPPDQTINKLQATNHESGYGKLDNIIESDEDSDDEPTALDHELPSERPPATDSDPQTSHSPADNYDHDAKAPVGIDSNRDKTRQGHPLDISPRFEHHRAELWFGDRWVEALQNITSQLAIHLSSINRNEDLNSLQYHKQVLTELLPSFNALSNDPNMVDAIRVAMFTLRKKIKELPQVHEDSGYESTQNSRNKGTAATESTKTSRTCHPPMSRNTAYARTQEKVQSSNQKPDFSSGTVFPWREDPSNLSSSNEQPEIPCYHQFEDIGDDTRRFAGIDASKAQVPDIEYLHNTSTAGMGIGTSSVTKDKASGIKEARKYDDGPPFTFSPVRTHVDEPVKILPRLPLPTSHHTQVADLSLRCPPPSSDKRQGSLLKDEDDNLRPLR